MTLTEVIPTRYGPVQGRRRATDEVFLGVPYAAPPVGPATATPPQPPTPWVEPKQCVDYSATAKISRIDLGLISEPCIPGTDCLTVNIFRPLDCPAEASLPVLVFIHGGSFVDGSPASPAYDGEVFTREGIIFVTLGYRLGVAGFAPLEDQPDQAGTLDWLAALQWVQDNIAHFGGDPQQVTVSGQSAGGGAVLWLCGDPRAEGLFQRAMAFSPSIPVFRTATLMRRLRRHLGGRVTSRALARLDPQRRITIERTLGRQQLAGVPIGPVDTQPPRPGVELLIGSTRDEMLTTRQAKRIDALPRPVRAAVIAALWPAFHPRPGRLREFLRHTPQRPAGVAAGDSMIRRFVPLWAEQAARAYAYEIRFPGEGLARHCADLPLLFDYWATARSRRVLSGVIPTRVNTSFRRAIVQFVRTGDPGWPAYTSSPQRITAVWDDDADFHTEAGVYEEVARIWGPLKH